MVCPVPVVEEKGKRTKIPQQSHCLPFNLMLALWHTLTVHCFCITSVHTEILCIPSLSAQRCFLTAIQNLKSPLFILAVWQKLNATDCRIIIELLNTLHVAFLYWLWDCTPFPNACSPTAKKKLPHWSCWRKRRFNLMRHSVLIIPACPFTHVNHSKPLLIVCGTISYASLCDWI